MLDVPFIVLGVLGVFIVLVVPSNVLDLPATFDKAMVFFVVAVVSVSVFVARRNSINSINSFTDSNSCCSIRSWYVNFL